MLKDVSNLVFKVEASNLLIKALKLFESRKFDAILLDLNLPDSMGIDTVSKTLEDIRDTPIIILTGLYHFNWFK
jgi:DNA-binding response OmpR family regulator